jgi:hypothetical protein
MFTFFVSPASAEVVFNISCPASAEFNPQMIIVAGCVKARGYFIKLVLSLALEYGEMHNGYKNNYMKLPFTQSQCLGLYVNSIFLYVNSKNLFRNRRVDIEKTNIYCDYRKYLIRKEIGR